MPVQRPRLLRGGRAAADDAAVVDERGGVRSAGRGVEGDDGALLPRHGVGAAEQGVLRPAVRVQVAQRAGDVGRRARVPGAMSDLRTLADAVMYEGYMLWPYRRTALKNQRRWTFGGGFPPAWTAAHPDDACAMQTQVLVEGEPSVTVRFLQVVGDEG